MLRNLVSFVFKSGGDALAEYNATELGKLARDLGSLGVSVSLGYDGDGFATLSFEYDADALDEAAHPATGRRRDTALPGGSPLVGMTCGEALAWLDCHTEREAMPALGVSRAQFYRRKRELSDYLAADAARSEVDFVEAYRWRIKRALSSLAAKTTGQETER